MGIQLQPQWWLDAINFLQQPQVTEATSSQSISAFKSKLKTYLFSLSFPNLDCKVTEVQFCIIHCMYVCMYPVDGSSTSICSSSPLQCFCSSLVKYLLVRHYWSSLSGWDTGINIMYHIVLCGKGKKEKGWVRLERGSRGGKEGAAMGEWEGMDTEKVLIWGHYMGSTGQCTENTNKAAN